MTLYVTAATVAYLPTKDGESWHGRGHTTATLLQHEAGLMRLQGYSRGFSMLVSETGEPRWDSERPPCMAAPMQVLASESERPTTPTRAAGAG